MHGNFTKVIYRPVFCRGKEKKYNSHVVTCRKDFLFNSSGAHATCGPRTGDCRWLQSQPPGLVFRGLPLEERSLIHSVMAQAAKAAVRTQGVGRSCLKEAGRCPRNPRAGSQGARWNRRRGTAGRDSTGTPAEARRTCRTVCFSKNLSSLWGHGRKEKRKIRQGQIYRS